MQQLSASIAALAGLVLIGAGDYIPPPAEAPEWPLHRCMTEQAAHYGLKTDDVGAAVTAAHAACIDIRGQLSDELFRQAVALGKSKSNAKVVSEALLERIERDLQPFYIKAALDAR